MIKNLFIKNFVLFRITQLITLLIFLLEIKLNIKTMIETMKKIQNFSSLIFFTI